MRLGGIQPPILNRKPGAKWLIMDAEVESTSVTLDLIGTRVSVRRVVEVEATMNVVISR